MTDGARFNAAVSAWDLLASLPDPTFIVSRRGRIVAANRPADAAFGYRRGALIGLDLAALIPRRFRAQHAGLHAAYRAHPVTRAMGDGLEVVALRRDGTEFPAEVSLSALAGRGERMIIASVRDLGTRRGAHDSRERERRRFLERVITAQDEERRRIARELHDEAGGALASLMVRLRTLQDTGSLRAAKAQAARLRKGLAETIGGLARLARGLHPSVLDDLGLAPALRRHAADTAEALGVPIAVTLRGLGPRRLPRAVEIALYRIAQEALSNVVRHAGAKRVELSLTRTAGALRLEVTDDGRGFDPRTRSARRVSAPGSLGLLGIRERAAALGGAASITSAPGRGTTVAVVLPAPAGAERRRHPRRAARRVAR